MPGARAARSFAGDSRPAGTLRDRAPMPERHDLEALFVQHLPLIERTVAAVCRRHGVRGADAEDCASWVKLRMVEDGYAALAKFRGESSLPTYLAVVVAMLCRDWRVQGVGRWRPSAAAQRLGAIATRLERMLRRDGVSLREAGERLRTEGEIGASDRELAAMVTELPDRRPMRPVEVTTDAVTEHESGTTADAGVAFEERDADHRATGGALAAAMARLPAEDQVILRLRFWDGLGIADVARALSLEQRPLYRRQERLLAELRRALEAAGVTRERVRTLLDDLPDH